MSPRGVCCRIYTAIAGVLVGVTSMPGLAGAPGLSLPRVAIAPQAQTAEWTFDSDRPGAVPPGARVLSGTWEVRAEPGAPTGPNALCQTGAAEFPAIVLSSSTYADIAVDVAFKPVSGREDRAAGIIFRIQDRENYYILRANALEDNVNLYKYARGQRLEIAGSAAKVATGQWQRLGVEAIGSRLRGLLNGRQVVEATDATFQRGGVGLWTKADSVSCFDNVRLAPR